MHSVYPNLLSPFRVGNTILKNRMICPPSAPYQVSGGEMGPSEGLIACYAGRARAGAAIVTCDGCSFSPRPGGNGWDASNPDAKNRMAQMVDAIHFYGAKAHGVLMVFPPADLERMTASGPKTGDEKPEPSPNLEDIPAEELYATIEKYAQLAKNMADCGFDGTYIHMSYRMVLPGKLLSPISNKRTDEFGGSFENRIRFPLLLCRRVKELCGEDFLIEAAISGHDQEENGWSLNDSVCFAQAAQGLIDIMTIRSPEIDSQHPTGFSKGRTPWLPLAEHIRREVKKRGINMAVAAAGGFFEPDDCESAIAEGKADLLSMARAFISNPDYGTALYEGRADTLTPCLRCNKCHSANHNLTVCVVNPRFAAESRVDKFIVPTKGGKRVAVIGGGPAGMKLAITAAERGHTVTIYEKRDRLGGLIDHARYAEFKWPMLKLLEFFERKCMNNPAITVKLNTEPDPAAVEAENYDVVVAALGSVPIIPPITGADKAIPAAYAFGSEDKLADTVAIIGGGEIGVEVGLHLAQKGKNVVVLEMKSIAAEEALLGHGHYYSMFIGAVNEQSERLNILLRVKCTEIRSDGVSYLDETGEEHTVNAGSVLLAVGMRSNTDAAMRYASCGKQFFTIGDCGSMGNLQTAIRSAYQIGSSF